MKKILLILCLLLLSGCTLFKNDIMEDIEVYTTTYPASYLVNYLYGEHATIYSIYPNGVNFKEYDLSDKKINEFSKSDLFVFNSQDQDRDFAVSMINKNPDLKLIDVSLGMNYTNAIEELWLNPYNYLMMAKNVTDSLDEYITDPYLIKGINKKYEDLKYDLSKLDATYKDTLLDAKYKTIVTDNDFFKFLEKYGINVISLEEDIVTITIEEDDSLSNISKEYGVAVNDILTYNGKTNEVLKLGEVIKIPIKVVDSSNINRVKKLIADKQILYVYSDSATSNEVVNNLITENKLGLVTINSMYSIDGGVTTTNDSYLTIMNDNLELLKKELYK